MSTLNPTTDAPIAREGQPRQGGKVMTRILAVVGRILALIAAIVLCLLLVLLPISTAVPAWVWIPLSIAAIALILVQFRMTPAWRGIAVSLAGLVLVSLIAVLASQSFAMTPPIIDSQGNTIPGSPSRAAGE